MYLNSLKASLRALWLIPILVACHAFFAAAASAQGTATSVGTSSAGGQLVVLVRNAAGEPLATPALVRLYSEDGMPLGTASAVNGGQASFRNVPTGRYTVEVEASGYTLGHTSALLPMTGEVDVEVYLQPEKADAPVVLAGADVPVLAPKAKKEMDAGLAALRQKDLSKAQKHLENAYRMAPNHPEVLYLLGSLYAQQNDLGQAEGYLQKATEMEPQHAPAQGALGIVLANEHKFEAAVVPLKKALDLNEKSWEARWALARCYYTQRDYEGTLEQSTRAVRDSNGLAPEIALVVAASQTALRRYDEAATTLREFLQQHADNRGAPRAKRWLEHLEQTGKIKPE